MAQPHLTQEQWDTALLQRFGYRQEFLNNIASLLARFKGWPHEKAPFSLGRWGVLINTLALVYGGLMIINFLWFGGQRNGFLTNPYLSTAFPGLSGIPALGNIPILELLLVLLFGIGAIYWFGFKRRQVLASGAVGASTQVDVAD